MGDSIAVFAESVHQPSIPSAAVPCELTCLVQMSLVLVSRVRHPDVVLFSHCKTDRKDSCRPIEQVPHGRVRPVLCSPYRLGWCWTDRAEDDVEGERVEVVKVFLSNLVSPRDVLPVSRDPQEDWCDVRCQPLPVSESGYLALSTR